MNVLPSAVFFLFLISASLQAFDRAPEAASETESKAAQALVISGFRDAAHEQELEKKFMAVPDPKLAEQHLRILTQPHIAGSPEDKATAEYVAGKFREAGLDTTISEYRVWLNYPSEIRVDLTAPAGVSTCTARSAST